MKTSDEIDKVSAALVAAQALMLPLIKDSDNPFFKSKYADLHAVTQACYPALQANGICVIQSAESLGADGINIRTRLLHSSGQFIETDCAIPPAGQDPQKYGSAVTYGRRYGLQAAVGLAATDDDGEAAMNRKGHQEPTKTGPTLEQVLKSIADAATLESLTTLGTKIKGTEHASNPKVKEAYEARKSELF